jgi:TetR/AcrR family transcriptional regulator, ethionamide resistance regulator
VASTTRRTKTARADRQSEIQRRIHDAIVALVAEGESFTELSVERIVARAGISRSTFYVYFADKGELLRALGTAVLHRLYEGARPWFAKGENASRGDIRDSMRAVLGAFREDEVIMTAFAETAVYDPDVREMYRDNVEAFVRSLRKLIQRGRESGKIRDVDGPAVAATLSWMIERTTTQLAASAKPRDLDQIADALAEVIWATLYTGKAR